MSEPVQLPLERPSIMFRFAEDTKIVFADFTIYYEGKPEGAIWFAIRRVHDQVIVGYTPKQDVAFLPKKHEGWKRHRFTFERDTDMGRKLGVYCEKGLEYEFVPMPTWEKMPVRLIP